jgi:hypothetical protein
MKICFTSIFSDYDNLKDPLLPNHDWEYVCFTDQDLKSDVWSIEKVESGDSKKLSRKYKLPNLFSEYDLSLYLDATFEIGGNLNRLTNGREKGIWLNRHPQRQCAYEELEIIKNKGLDQPEIIDHQTARYIVEGLPEQYGLWRCGIIIRNPKDDQVSELCNLWYNEVLNGTYRDQPSFTYSVWKTGVMPNDIPHGLTNKLLRQSLHKSHPTEHWLYDSGEPVEKDNPLISKYDTAHLILLKDRFLIPKWMKNYVNPKVGKDRYEELVKILGGTIVRG